MDNNDDDDDDDDDTQHIQHIQQWYSWVINNPSMLHEYIFGFSQFSDLLLYVYFSPVEH